MMRFGPLAWAFFVLTRSVRRRFNACLVACWAMSLASAAAADLPTRFVLGTAQPYDLAEEEPHVAMQLRFGPAGERLSAWRRSGRAELWSLATATAEVRWNTASVYADSPDLDEAVGLIGSRLTLMSSGRSERQRGVAPQHLALSNNRRLVAAADTPGLVLRDLQTGQARGFGTELPVRNGLAISPDGRYIVAATGTHGEGGHETALEIHDVHENTRQVIKSPGVVLGMWRLAISVNNRLAFGTQRNGKAGVLVLDLASGARLLEQGEFSSHWVRGLAIAADGSVLLTGDDKGFLRLWSIDAKRKLFELKQPQPIQTVAIDGQRRRIAWALWDGTIHVASMRAGYGGFAEAQAAPTTMLEGRKTQR